MCVPPVKKPIVDETTRGESLMYTKNNNGSNKGPCGTPDATWATEHYRTFNSYSLGSIFQEVFNPFRIFTSNNNMLSF